LPCRWNISRCPLALDITERSGDEWTNSVKEPHRFSMRAPCLSYGAYRSSSRIVSTLPLERRTLSRTEMERRL
jgi:hypothetical protein